MALDYQFENLGEDRFQHFCQALLIPEFPNAQCFPIRQQDGGRDAVSPYWALLDSPFVVFQVKYVRRPLAESEPWKWLAKTIEAELPKIRKLIPEGAQQIHSHDECSSHRPSRLGFDRQSEQVSCVAHSRFLLNAGGEATLVGVLTVSQTYAGPFLSLSLARFTTVTARISTSR